MLNVFFRSAIAFLLFSVLIFFYKISIIYTHSSVRLVVIKHVLSFVLNWFYCSSNFLVFHSPNRSITNQNSLWLFYIWLCFYGILIIIVYAFCTNKAKFGKIKSIKEGKVLILKTIKWTLMMAKKTASNKTG